MTDETKWGEWRGEGDYRHFWRPLLNTDSFQELTPAYLNALEREVHDLRAYKVLADELLGGNDSFVLVRGRRIECGWCGGYAQEHAKVSHAEDCPKARYDSLPSTSEGEGK